MTHATRDFVWVMRIYALIYLAGALLFFFMPGEVFYLINIGPRVLKLGEEIPMPSEHFWLVLATSMMMMLFFASAYSSMYPQIKGFVAIHAISKITSVAGFTFLFVKQKYFAYAFGAAVDALVILSVLIFYLRSAAGRPPAASAGASAGVSSNDGPPNEP